MKKLVVLILTAVVLICLLLAGLIYFVELPREAHISASMKDLPPGISEAIETWHGDYAGDGVVFTPPYIKGKLLISYFSGLTREKIGKNTLAFRLTKGDKVWVRPIQFDSRKSCVATSCFFNAPGTWVVRVGILDMQNDKWGASSETTFEVR